MALSIGTFPRIWGWTSETVWYSRLILFLFFNWTLFLVFKWGESMGIQHKHVWMKWWTRTQLIFSQILLGSSGLLQVPPQILRRYLSPKTSLCLWYFQGFTNLRYFHLGFFQGFMNQQIQRIPRLEISEYLMETFSSCNVWYIYTVIIYIYICVNLHDIPILIAVIDPYPSIIHHIYTYLYSIYIINPLETNLVPCHMTNPPMRLQELSEKNIVYRDPRREDPKRFFCCFFQFPRAKRGVTGFVMFLF